jgi:chromosome condensin MukBEF ATPase and DNA-binding subunit MukB
MTTNRRLRALRRRLAEWQERKRILLAMAERGWKQCALLTNAQLSAEKLEKQNRLKEAAHKLTRCHALSLHWRNRNEDSMATNRSSMLRADSWLNGRNGTARCGAELERPPRRGEGRRCR